jgi:RNA polymerase sigma-70 factor (ECF subfamily)
MHDPGPREPEPAAAPLPPLAELLDRLRAGDEDAARAIHARFTPGLLRLARRQLRYARHKADPESVVQSVYRSFFVRQRAGEYTLDDWDGLWALLTRITLRKCWNRVRYHRQKCRDLDREQQLLSDQDAAALVASEPTPLQAAVLTETVTGLLAGVRDRERQIRELLLQGRDVEQIRVEVRCGERTVRRVRDRLRARLEALLGQEDSAPGSG